ncbi:hypothetical protein [Polaromonas sp. YR568]|uniref:COG3904 family protein n=1 Tax=Polaromonas sp. YR568 TaxID=1855301 RepID=UPI0031380917
MMRAIVTFLISVLACACLPAAAADIQAYQRGVLIRGTIEKGDYDRIIEFVRHPDNYGRFARMVYLDSSGGDVVEAIKIAHLLDKSYAATHVASGARCYSACFILWMSGVTRHVSSGATLGVHRIHVQLKEGSIDQQSAYVSQIARTVENYMSGLGTPRAILDKMNATAPADLFVISPRWLAEQRLLTAVSYRLGFIDAAQARCGPEPVAQAMKGRAPPADDEAEGWVAQIKSWITCADELRASNQRGEGLTIAALLGQ